MEKGYYKTEKILITKNCFDKPVYDAEKNLLYIEHIEEPVYEDVQTFVEYTEQELAKIEMNECEGWFNSIYTYQEQKYRRLIALGLTDDDGVSAEEKLLELYNEAEVKRKRIQELEKLI